MVVVRFAFPFSVCALALASGPALACDCVTLIAGSPHFQADLDRIAQFYPVAADGVLEGEEPYGWRFRTTREYRGPGFGSYSIQLLSDCSVDPVAMKGLIGRPVFLMLAVGQGQSRGTYEINRCVNLLGGDVEQAIRDKMGAGCKSR